MSNQQSEQTQTISNPLDIVKFEFRFRKDSSGNKRDNLVLSLPTPNIEGIINIIKNGGKQLQLLQDVVTQTVRERIQEVISEDAGISQSNFPIEKITWESIANLPKGERVNIPAELWEAFGKDYHYVMTEVIGQAEKRVTAAIAIFLKKLIQVKTNKIALRALQTQLAMYVEHPTSEQFTSIITLLSSRIENYLSEGEVTGLVDDLMS